MFPSDRNDDLVKALIAAGIAFFHRFIDAQDAPGAVTYDDLFGPVPEPVRESFKAFLLLFRTATPFSHWR